MSDIPQSLLEALNRTSRSLSERPLVSVMDVLEQWFAAHDMVEVVRCSKCRYSYSYTTELGAGTEYLCRNDDAALAYLPVCADDYCADGERNGQAVSANDTQVPAPTTREGE